VVGLKEAENTGQGISSRGGCQEPRFDSVVRNSKKDQKRCKYDLKNHFRAGMVVLACNPRYSGGGDWEDHRLVRGNPQKKVLETSSQPIQSGCCGRCLSSSYHGEGPPGRNVSPYLKNT
jgi:hypothetical protein